MNKAELQNLIKELIEKTTVVVDEISVIEDGVNAKNTWFGVVVKEPQYFINRDGEGLAAVNHLVRKMIEKKMPQKTPMDSEAIQLMIDINGFQKKRVDSLRAVAHMMAERARYFKSSVEVDPMSAFERRIVHEFLSDAADLQTESVGIGITRRVVIKYTGSL